ncbi:MAG: Gfo/Idh/MocA family oxidoreductase [Micropruina sp.]|uniref:Gfo/Idh/MocA family protein n=1 Tax=Micropruina sp. TaxID=2737536 RepID=UPI0039E47292
MLRFGIIGTNFISEWFAAACRDTGGRAEPVAVYSRDLGRGRAFADANGIGAAHDDLEALIEAVDAVYVASPNAAHHPQAMRAIEAGRHVLVEKVSGVSSAQVEEIFAAARARGVVAMEAVRNVHTPAHALVRATLPRLGAVRHARFEKLQYSSRYDRFRAGEQLNAFDPSLDNSALADIGVYCLQPALDLFGEPAQASGASVWLANGFEGGGSLQLDYGSTVVDVVYSKIAAGLGPSVIYGEDAALTLDDPGELSRIELHERGGATTVLLEGQRVLPAETMKHEINDFVDQAEAGVIDRRWAELSLASRRIMDEQLSRGR